MDTKALFTIEEMEINKMSIFWLSPLGIQPTYSSELSFVEASHYWFIISYDGCSICFQTSLYRHLKLSQTLGNSMCYCYTSYEMTDPFLWFQLQKNSYCRNWNTPYWSLIVTAGEFKKCNLDVGTL